MIHLSKRTRSGYDQAVNDIKDLRDLAIYLGDNNMFNKKMAEILEEFGKSKALLDRLKYAQLIK